MTTKASELLPCPFCGGSFVVAGKDKNSSGEYRYRVMCNENNCGVDVQTYDTDTREEAIALWNTRDAPTGSDLISRNDAMRLLEQAAMLADPQGVIADESDPEYQNLARLRNTLKSAAVAIAALPSLKGTNNV